MFLHFLFSLVLLGLGITMMTPSFVGELIGSEVLARQTFVPLIRFVGFLVLIGAIQCLFDLSTCRKSDEDTPVTSEGARDSA